ncbi:MAG: DUF1549 domain-containing protein [Pirellulaceae bacterium]|nr:DUF1549 domain-containing protein [Pirellulaceae bacterium]
MDPHRNHPHSNHWFASRLHGNLPGVTHPQRYAAWLGIALCLGLLGPSRVLAQATSAPATGTPTPSQLEFFEQKVRPLLVAKCYECHSADTEKLKGGLRLDDRQSILTGGDNGAAIVAGKIDESLLIKAVRYDEVGLEMPPSGKLSAREIEIFEQWVGMGAPFPASEVAEVKRRVIDIAAGKQHWAFRPLPPQITAPVDPSTWSLNRVDSFIRASQLENQVEPLPTSQPVKLLRRAKFDLLGVPPSPEEVEEFLIDPSPQAYEEQIDRWLSSPRYGERWGRFWLELARYCDIAESWAESQGNSYLYRDWVVKAYNQDLPFDRFAKLQLAADLMSDAETSDLAALGFIGLSPTYWKELQLPVEIIKTIVSDEYEERVHTFSSTFFGLNIACARCHDHKFDPITQHDYYALAGVFASTRMADRALVPGVDSIKIYEAHKQVEKWEAEIKKLNAEIKKLQAPTEDAVKKAENEKALAAKNEQIAKVTTQIQETKAMPGYDQPLVPGALDATLEVKPAEGTHGSRIVYNPAPKDAAVEIRGNPNKLGEVVPRRYVTVLSKEQPQSFTRGSGRLELAECMLEDSQSLIARVTVNRIWKLHFGTGLVDTPSDFGVQGMPPSHPALLDDLASRFIASGWSTKWLHRQLMLSATYRQQSLATAGSGSGGPAAINASSNAHKLNYVGAPLRRLEVEQWRDAMLMATNALTLQVGGPPSELSDSQHNRRTLYGTVRRRELTDILRLNDFPDPLTHSPSRSSTITPLQQLYTLNSPFMQQQSVALVERLEREAVDGQGQADQNKIVRAYSLLFNREPTTKELELGLQFVKDQPKEVWHEYAQVLLGSNEFLFVD